MKRIFDFFAALIGLATLIPLLFIISILVKLSSKGPILFKQKRVGKGGQTFLLYKFRSMRLKALSSEGSFEPGNTSRITYVGRFLRRTKLDELPQLINVIIGDMSIVGPRPEVQKWVDIYPDRWKQILTLRPGITDNTSIVYRNEEKILVESQTPEITYKEDILPKKLDFYEEYVLNHSFFGDIKLIFKTLFSSSQMKKQ